MAWNYRVFHTRWQLPDEEAIDSFTIREAYYAPERGDALYAITASRGGCRGPAGSTRTELMKDLARMQEAFARPVLTPADIPGYQYAPYEIPLDTDPASQPAVVGN